MKQAIALSILHEVDGRQYAYMKAWGLSLIREAVQTILDRKKVSQADREMAQKISETIYKNSFGSN